MITNQVYDQERALYGIHDTEVVSCRFAGEQDGESPFKETNKLEVKDCYLDLRYPFWHMKDSLIEHCELTENCRAALWYDERIQINHSKLHGIKALRECRDVVLQNCDVISAEFGWMSSDICVEETHLIGEYPFLYSKNLQLDHFDLKGKYSFQYVENMVIRNSVLDTKDAFWHSKNVTVYDSVIKGEYLAWYSQNLKLVRCTIIGTQPLCYAKGLVLEDCIMKECDLSFEYSEVQASVKGSIVSVKNPLSGKIIAGQIGEIILDENLKAGSDCLIEETEN